MRNTLLSLTLLAVSLPAGALQLQISDAGGQPLAQAMVSLKAERPWRAAGDDNGYPRERSEQRISPEITGFSGADGRLQIDYAEPVSLNLRVRVPGYRDLQQNGVAHDAVLTLRLQAETDPAALAAQQPANAWFAALDFGGDEALRKTALEQCGFCHQQGSFFMRRERSLEEWQQVLERMIAYGARPASKLEQPLLEVFHKGYADLRQNPHKVPRAKPWEDHLSSSRIVEWPLGDAFSQMHDLLLHSNGKVYVGDNLQDRLWEIDPRTGQAVVYKTPVDKGDEIGGLFSGRLKTYPKLETTAGIHSFAESPKDGHIFITPSLQRRLFEFDPASKTFTTHYFDQGLYPHTVRIDAQDRVWFTLALSNQVARFDRASGEFRLYDLPARSTKESIGLALNGVVRRLMNWGLPMHWLPVDERVSGMPMPYGIDIAPDGKVWFARLHADSIGVIDPADDSVQVIDTPFQAPRRMRVDAVGDLWISAFPEGKIVRYRPADGSFTDFPLPSAINDVETPYSLNVDRQRQQVWVNGTSSDTLLRLDIASGEWRTYPLPRKVSFTRDVEIAADGSIYTSNSAFPSWQIEDGQPTLIRLIPGE
ncbi:Vgb family protein [Pseudomonas xionganensis]|uniref:Lyase n=1 Tax=Pseudomonas xionganensis TaxID=2654845 RepID=A0A6I4KQ56_9PSED|nr:lyase [Pseudomonas xionganensis]MVW74177.1 lyase [Pseudomonas xionganensis]